MLPVPSFSQLRDDILALDFVELKPIVSLVRFGVIPASNDRTLLSKIPKSLFSRLFHSRSNMEPSLTQFGQRFFAVSTRPLLSASIISVALSVIPPEEEVENLKLLSASKEISVMEKIPEPNGINWQMFLEPDPSVDQILPEAAANPRMINLIRRGVHAFRDKVEGTLFWPYSTAKGLSKDTANRYQGWMLYKDRPWVDHSKESSPVSSRDVVAAFLHHGFWTPGLCEMRQRWYPTQLVPRTYFAQGGDAVRTSCYLRDFFNDLCDTLESTNRFSRVDGNRLITYKDGYFFIYDLTSFTSNFHEQKYFLKSLSDFFRGTMVNLVSFRLDVISADLGDLILDYMETVNINPRYRFHDRLFVYSSNSPPPVHGVAGFLGVPGNLATCTFAHGIAVALHIDDTRKQSCAGDDGNVGVKDKTMEQNVSVTICRLGIFQPEKGSSTFGEAASYLKRRFIQVNNHGAMIERVEFPLLSVVHAFKKPDPRFESLSDDLPELRRKVASSVCTFIRSLFARTGGVYLDGEEEYIMEFLDYVYRWVDLPRGGSLRGMLLDDSDYCRSVEEKVVFPLHTDYLRADPDALFSRQFAPWVVDVPVQTDILITSYKGNWNVGESRECRSNSSLNKLVTYGFLERVQQKSRTLVGEQAQDHFRRLLKEEARNELYEYTPLVDLSMDKLIQLGLHIPESIYDIRPQFHRKHMGRYSYKDLDAPGGSTFDTLVDRSVTSHSETLLGALDTAAVLDYD
jgi:hypothetical protein